MNLNFKNTLALLLLILPSTILAIEADEVRNFEDVFRISASAPDQKRIEVRWEIEPGYYLYNNRFLEFKTDTSGVVLGEPVIPPGERKYDELMGEEVIKFHDELVVGVPLDSVPQGTSRIELKVRSQGCLEAVLCYPPTWQNVVVNLPTGSSTSLQNGLLVAPMAGAGDSLVDSDRALAPEEAFVYEAIGLSAGTVLVRFTAQPGYYLYRDKFEFRTLEKGFEIRQADLPTGVIKDDPEFGPVPVIFGQVEIPVRLNRPAGQPQMISLEADFQGCRDGDICYPPQSRVVELQLPGSTSAIGQPNVDPDGADDSTPPAVVTTPVSEQDRLARLLVDSPVSALVAFFLAGLLLAFTPCVFPMIPILSGIIAGQGDRLTTTRAFWLSLVYVLAMALTYTVAGVLAGLFGKNLQAMFQNPWIIGSFVGVFVLLAMSMFGFFELQLPSRWQTRLSEVSNRQQGGNLGGVAVMGFLSALIVGPCVAPPLAAALVVIGASGDAVLGGSALFALSMGMGVPLILFGVSAGKLVPRAGAWMDAVKAVFGVGLLALGIWMLERILPGGTIMLLWGLLLVSCGVYLGALDRIAEGASGWKRLWKSLGVILLVLGVLELVGAAAGGDRWLQPLHGIRGGGQAIQEETVHFRRIKSLDDLQKALDQSSASGRPAMLDFYADWCVECIRMERNTFSDPGVLAVLSKLSLLQTDVTAYDDIDQALMKRLGIAGPPAILFFDKQGKEMKAWRLVGYFSPDEFTAHVQKVIAAQ
jgi:thiol:disulfide interchange protein DsbD